MSLVDFAVATDLQPGDDPEVAEQPQHAVGQLAADRSVLEDDARPAVDVATTSRRPARAGEQRPLVRVAARPRSDRGAAARSSCGRGPRSPSTSAASSRDDDRRRSSPSAAPHGALTPCARQYASDLAPRGRPRRVGWKLHVSRARSAVARGRGPPRRRARRRARTRRRRSIRAGTYVPFFAVPTRRVARPRGRAPQPRGAASRPTAGRRASARRRRAGDSSAGGAAPASRAPTAATSRRRGADDDLLRREPGALDRADARRATAPSHAAGPRPCATGSQSSVVEVARQLDGPFASPSTNGWSGVHADPAAHLRAHLERRRRRYARRVSAATGRNSGAVAARSPGQHLEAVGLDAPASPPSLRRQSCSSVDSARRARARARAPSPRRRSTSRRSRCPARRKCGPSRWSRPTPFATSTTSAPTSSHTFAISLMKLMRVDEERVRGELHELRRRDVRAHDLGLDAA